MFSSLFSLNTQDVVVTHQRHQMGNDCCVRLLHGTLRKISSGKEMSSLSAFLVRSGASPLSGFNVSRSLRWPQLSMTQPAACWLRMSVCVCVGHVHRCASTSRIPAGVCINNPQGRVKRTSGGYVHCLVCSASTSLSSCNATEFGEEVVSVFFFNHVITVGHFNNCNKQLSECIESNTGS